MQEVTGIYTNNFDLSLNTKNGFPVFATVVEANYVTKKQDLFSAYKLTQEDKTQIEELSKDPRIVERVSWRKILSIASKFFSLKHYFNLSLRSLSQLLRQYMATRISKQL